MIARLQQVTTLTLLSGALAWLLLHWGASPAYALCGFVMILLGYSLFLAAEFAALRILDRQDAERTPTWRELAGAWVGETMTAPRVFCWRQPFRSREVPDHLTGAQLDTSRRGIVFIHGFLCNRGFWTPWLRVFKAEGHAFVAVNLEPPFGSIDSYAHAINEAVSRVFEATGRAPVLVCHSMGGLAARGWLRIHGGEGRAHHIVTMGSPHGGTWLGKFSRMENGREMRLSSSWLQAMATHEEGARATPFTCWYSNCDNIVFPVTTAALPGADNRMVRGLAHVQLAFDRRVMDGTRAIINAL